MDNTMDMRAYAEQRMYTWEFRAAMAVALVIVVVSMLYAYLFYAFRYGLPSVLRGIRMSLKLYVTHRRRFL